MDKIKDFEWRLDYAEDVLPDSTVPGWTEVDEVCSECCMQDYLDPRLPQATETHLEDSSINTLEAISMASFFDFVGDGPFEITKVDPKLKES